MSVKARLFARSRLRLARDRGSAPSAPLRLPDGVRDVIRMRLASLTPAARALLDAGYVSGRTLDLGVAAALIELPLAAARDLAAEAVHHDVLVDTGDRTAFSHILIQACRFSDRIELAAEKL